MSRLNLWKPEPKRRAGIVRPAVVPGLALSRYSCKELGVRIVRRSNLPTQEPGIAWARLMRAANRPAKDDARDAVLRLLTRECFPRLSMFTFPASEWRFERALLAVREGEKEMRRRGPTWTRILSVERDEAIYRAACHNIPRGREGTRSGRVRVFNAPSFATACVNSPHIERFFRCTVEDYAAGERHEYGQGVRFFDAAWLDFNGHLSPSRLTAIERFWSQRLRSLLVVTLLNARMGDWITARVKHHGSLEQLLSTSLPGSVIESVSCYGDGAPMLQVVLRRTSGEPSLAVEATA